MATTAPAQRKSLKYIKDDVQFYPHQIEGARWGAKRNNFILADEMGLGKSLEALTVAAIDFERDSPEERWIDTGRILCVVPASLKGNWFEEIKEHTKFVPLVMERWTPKKRSQFLADLHDRDDWQVLIVNYEQVAPHLKELNALEFDFVIYDEAHALKGHKSKRTIACHKLYGGRHFLLTGSPMLNNVNELWSLLHRCDPRRFPNYWFFVNRYCVFGGYKDKQIVGVKNEAELKALLEEYMLRRLKKDVLDLPEKHYVKIWVDLHDEQKRLYQQVNEDLMLEIPGEPEPQDIENALHQYTKLKQICGTTATIEGYEDFSLKLDRVVEDILELAENGQRCVVWTQFRGVLAALQDRLDKAEKSKTIQGPPSYTIHGDVDAKDRVPIVRKWAADPKPAVMLAMLQVGGVGLNMTAARHALFVDKLFVPTLNEQAVDRIHRIGASTTVPVQIREYIARGTVEQRVETILRRKVRIFDTVVNPSDFKKKLVMAMQENEDE